MCVCVCVINVIVMCILPINSIENACVCLCVCLSCLGRQILTNQMRNIVHLISLATRVFVCCLPICHLAGA